MKSKKSALLKSLIALLLCLSMLVGTTFAWFTDSVSTGLNTIAAGNLDVELYHTNAATRDEKVDASTDLFLDLQGEDILWEPGVVSYENLRVVNEGDLALAYQMSIATANENHVVDPSGAIYGLSQILKVGVVEGGITATDRAGVVASVGEGNWITLGEFLRSGSLLPQGDAEAEDTWGVVIYWQPGENDNFWNLNNGKVLDQGEALQIDLGINLIATQEVYESDSFGSDYDTSAKADVFPEFVGGSASAPVVPDGNNCTSEAITMTSGDVTAVVPAGVQLAPGTTQLTLTVTEMEATGSNVQLNAGEAMRSLDVHIEGIDPANTAPITVALTEVVAKGLNMGNYKLYHVENGATNEMTLVDSAADFSAHNQFKYDPATGNITLYMASFSEVALVAEPAKWEGGVDHSWYKADEDVLTIANADQLWSFSQIVGGMAEGVTYPEDQTRDSFAGKTIKLISDIDLDDKEDASTNLFYPIGYYNDAKSYTKPTDGRATAANVTSFQGTFDGNGHTIANFYQNTWQMWGNYDGNYYKAAMGLFGYVVNGTVKNLTVDNFSSDGEYTPTGVIAAYAVNSTFENIAITNCNPRVYNTGNGGIIGIAGRENEATEAITLKNITVDNSNKISALWGSYDVACGGLVGMYRGNADNSGDTISFENCHVSAQMDVYNDVCANYQYYAYRYTGMLIGSVRENETINGHSYPKMDGITAKDCTVHFGTWNDYYYCEIIDNTTASYTHDYQMSRLTEIKAIDGTTITYLNGTTGTVPASGRANYVIVDYTKGHGTENATCYHFKDGKVWDHKDGGKETINGVEVLKEDKQHIYLEFNNLVTGYGWGVTSKGIDDFDGAIVLDKVYNGQLVDKFAKNDAWSGNFLYRVGNKNAFTIGKLFKEIGTYPVVDSGVHVSVTPMLEGVSMEGTFVKNESDWTQSTLHITGGTGLAKLTIQDYNNCKPFELIVEVVDAENLTSAKGTTTGGNFVLLCDVNTSTYVNYWGCTLYGNGFTYSLKDAPTAYNSKQGHGIIIIKNTTLDGVRIIGDVYNGYGVFTNNNYFNTAIDVVESSTIRNCYIANCAAPVKARSNVTIENTTLYGGAVANLIINSGTITLEDVTTVNYADGRECVGLGIAVHPDATEGVKLILNGTLTQYNYISEANKPADSSASSLYGEIFGSQCNEYHYGAYPNRYVNTGIASMSDVFNNTNIEDNANTGYSGKTVTLNGNDGYLYSKKNPDSVNNNYSESTLTQSTVPPNCSFDHTEKNYVPKQEGSNDHCYLENGTVNISMDAGDTFNWDTSILTVTKAGKTLDYTVNMNGVDYTGKSIAFNTAGEYTVSYTYTDDSNYTLDANGNITTYSKTYTNNIHIVVSVIEETTKHAEFTFGSSATATEKITIGNRTYVSAKDVNADNSTWASMTIEGQKIYYPILAAELTSTKGSNSYAYFPVFDNVVTITDYEDGKANGTKLEFNGSTTTLPSTLAAVKGYYGEASKISFSNLTEGNLNQTGPNKIFKWASGSDAPSNPITYNIDNDSTKELCFQSPSIEADRVKYITLVQYSYTDEANTTYYYYIGYTLAEFKKECVTPDTLITLANGKQVRVDSLTGNEELLVWNLKTGKYEAAPIVFVDSEEEAAYEIIHLYFSDGSDVKVIYEHGFFDLDLGKYVYIDATNYADYIGHRFVAAGNTRFNKWKIVTLDDVVIETEVTTAWSPVTFEHLCYYTNGVLSMPGGIEGLFNIFDVDTSTMRYDAEKMQKDIETYGLFTLEDFGGMITEDAFNAFNGAYLKVAMGKGLLTWEDIAYMAERYIPLM